MHTCTFEYIMQELQNQHNSYFHSILNTISTTKHTTCLLTTNCPMLFQHSHTILLHAYRKQTTMPYQTFIKLLQWTQPNKSTVQHVLQSKNTALGHVADLMPWRIQPHQQRQYCSKASLTDIMALHIDSSQQTRRMNCI